MEAVAGRHGRLHETPNKVRDHFASWWLRCSLTDKCCVSPCYDLLLVPLEETQTTGGGNGNEDDDEWGSLSDMSGNQYGEGGKDDDSFDGRLGETIKDGVNDVKEGRKVIQGEKRSHGDMKEINFTEEEEARNILRECPPDVVQAICNIPDINARIQALNDYLNGIILELPAEQQQIIHAKATASEKFSKLKEFVEEATAKIKKMKT